MNEILDFPALGDEANAELQDIAEIRDGNAIVKLSRTEAGLANLRADLDVMPIGQNQPPGVLTHGGELDIGVQDISRDCRMRAPGDRVSDQQTMGIERPRTTVHGPTGQALVAIVGTGDIQPFGVFAKLQAKGARAARHAKTAPHLR